MMKKFIFEESYISYVNLDHRVDRLNHMTSELSRVGINAHRTRGLLPHEVPQDVHKHRIMMQRTKGALGCWMSQVSIMEEALKLKKHAVVFEDDVIFCSDIKERIAHIENFLNTHEWDVMWLGGTVHVNPSHWHVKGNADLPDAIIGQDAQVTSDPRILRTYGAFSTYAYIVNYNSLPKVLKLLDENMRYSMGIDWCFIKVQPQLQAYMYMPGCVKQMDNQSDIGGGMTMFSGFEKSCGPYWWQDNKNDFNPDTFNWAEASNILHEEKFVSQEVFNEIIPDPIIENTAKPTQEKADVKIDILERNIAKDDTKNLVPIIIKNKSSVSKEVLLFDYDINYNEQEALVSCDKILISGVPYDVTVNTSIPYIKYSMLCGDAHFNEHARFNELIIISDNIKNMLQAIQHINEDDQKPKRTLTVPIVLSNHFDNIIRLGDMFALRVPFELPYGRGSNKVKLTIEPHSEIRLTFGLTKI